MNLQDFLIELRGDMTLKEASKRIGISLGYLRNLESGEKKNPSMEVLRKIANGYNCDLSELLKLAESEYTIETIEELGHNPKDHDENVPYYEKVKVVFNEDIDVVYRDEHGNPQLYGTTRYDIVSRFFDIGFILKHRERALYNGHPLNEDDRKRILIMLEQLFPDKK